MRQKIAISGIGGQGVLFLTRILAEAALFQNEEVITSEIHGMAMRGGSVISHLKVGGFRGPLIRPGEVDVLFFLEEGNLSAHSYFLKNEGVAYVNTMKPGNYRSIEATKIAIEIGTPLVANLVLLGYALGEKSLFCSEESINFVLEKISPRDQLKINQRALMMGIKRSGNTRAIR